jgi:Ras-related GTP-binding protein A/B
VSVCVFPPRQVLIYVFDIESRELAKDMEYYASCLQAVRQNSKSAKVFCLVHKMDLIPEEQREEVFAQRERELTQLAEPLGLEVACFKTSIWDETLYRAWSDMVYSLIPNREQLQAALQQLCEVCQADELVLFERATFLVISNAVLRAHADQHRFEKVSNIIKQFKLSCSKTASHFATMQVRNSRYSALIEGFTSTTYVMVIASDPKIQPASILINIEASRQHFEALIANMSTASNGGQQTGGEGTDSGALGSGVVGLS